MQSERCPIEGNVAERHEEGTVVDLYRLDAQAGKCAQVLLPTGGNCIGIQILITRVDAHRRPLVFGTRDLARRGHPDEVGVDHELHHLRHVLRRSAATEGSLKDVRNAGEAEHIDDIGQEDSQMPFQ